MKHKTGLIIVAVVVIAAIGGVVAFSMANKDDDKSKSADHAMSQDEMEKMDHEESVTNADDKPATTTDPGTTGSSAAATTAVIISDYTFGPEVIKVKVGDTVTWTNQDDVQHDVVADEASGAAPHGPLLAKGKSYSFKFTKAGTYSYHCSPHPYMKGAVEVTE